MKRMYNLYRIFLFLWISFVVCIWGIYLYAYISPKIVLNSANRIYLYDNKEELVFESNNNNDWVSLKDISKYVRNATIISEDKSFYNHSGFDYLRIGKAMFNNIKSGTIVEGASTISQQYVKNLYLDFNQTWKRKIDEAFLTIKLELRYSKDEILEGYLNTINYGQGNYGIASASKYYFNKNASDLTLEEALMLVGIPRSPENNNPISNYDNCIKRARIIASLLVKNGYITKEEYDNLYKDKIEIYGKRERNNMSTLMYYSDAVNEELNSISSIPKNLIKSGGIKIYTTLDVNAQKKLDDSIKENGSNEDDVQLAGILVNPKTGGVLALAGGKNYARSQYNRVTQSKRQVGSTIKPFLYYSALENGFTPSSTFLSERTTFNIGSELYSPKNANNVYANKNISMVSAIAYSDNIYALKTHLFLGEDNLSKMIERVKIKTPVKNNASAALGTTEINMLDYANGFITLANEGKHESPHLIERIEDANGNIIYEYKYENEYILNKKYVYILNNLLTSTYSYSLVNYASPTLVSISNKLDSKYAVKSGSTATDYWTVGYNKDVLILVWAGNDNNSKVKSSESRITKYIWANTITNLDVNKKEWYDIPKGVTSSVIDPISGDVSAKGFVCYYEKGTEPNYVYNNIFDPN